MKYLLNITFYAGSKDELDTDRGLYIYKSKDEIDKQDFVNLFSKASKLLSEEDSEFTYSYNSDGLNLDTLVKGVETFTKDKITKIRENCGYVAVGTYYELEIMA